MNTHPRPPKKRVKRVSTMRQYRAFRRGVEVGKRLAEWGRV